MQLLKELIKKFKWVILLLFVTGIVGGIALTQPLSPPVTESVLPTPMPPALDDIPRAVPFTTQEGQIYEYIPVIVGDWADDVFETVELVSIIQYRGWFLVSGGGQLKNSGEQAINVLVFIYDDTFTERWGPAGSYFQPPMPESREAMTSAVKDWEANAFTETKAVQVIIGPDGSWYVSMLGHPKAPVDGSEWEQWVIVVTPDGRLADEWLLMTSNEYEVLNSAVEAVLEVP